MEEGQEEQGRRDAVKVRLISTSNKRMCSACTVERTGFGGERSRAKIGREGREWGKRAGDRRGVSRMCEGKGVRKYERARQGGRGSERGRNR